jgi:hypothetical protein
MAILFSKEFGIKKSAMNKIGVFDAVLDADSHFFINIKRLQVTNVPEFADSYAKINEYFRQIGLLLKVAKIGDKNYRTAVKKFHFPEVNGINLGFSSSSRGAGFGSQLRDQIIKDAYEIIQSGSDQPEIFHLTSLFEENVGPDRLSDMFARLIHRDIVQYSQRVYKILDIVPEKYPSHRFLQGLPLNRYKKAFILLLPKSILHKLPIARCWDDIDRVCAENEAIRKEINDIIGAEWAKMASSAKKKCLLEWIFKNPGRLQRVLDSYRTSTVDEFNVYSNIDYLISFLRNEMAFAEEEQVTSMHASYMIIESYKKWVEYHRGSVVLQEVSTENGEKTVQRTLHATALMYCKEHNWDISPEVDSGRGPVDFKISRGNDKTAIEVKLTSNQQCLHGYITQIEEYAKAEDTENKIFIIVDNGISSERVKAVMKKREQLLADGQKPAEIVVIDAIPKKSASKY